MNKKKKIRMLHEISLREVLPYISIPVLLYAFMVVVPIGWAIYYSLHATLGWNMDFIGLDNYISLLEDEVFWIALRNSLFFVVISAVFQLGPALILLVFFVSKTIVKANFVRAIFFFPCIISPIVISYLWNIMYSNRYGLLNKLLEIVGLDFLAQNWLSDPNIILVSISIPLAWQYIGFYLILLIAGVSNISDDIFEVAQLDGAQGRTLLFKIILPLLKSSIMVSLVLCASGGVKIFEQVYAISGGGPGYASTVLAQFAYQTSFLHANYGYGTAISISMIIVSLILIGVVRLFIRNRGEDV